ncbi:MAG: hypothetical protein VX438_08420 [Planctomycetota bacterium]|nr:hypothetical protein [Planctomycetota bacterium]
MDRVIVFGGTGFLGLSLARHLSTRGFQPVLIARNVPQALSEFEFVSWDAVSVGNWKSELDGAMAIVNLTGKTVDCIKTPANCDLIL